MIQKTEEEETDQNEQLVEEREENDQERALCALLDEHPIHRMYLKQLKSHVRHRIPSTLDKKHRFQTSKFPINQPKIPFEAAIAHPNNYTISLRLPSSSRRPHIISMALGIS